jgi:hypothetical protein
LGRSPAEENSLQILRTKVAPKNAGTINVHQQTMICTLAYNSEAAFAFQLSHEAIIDQIFGP